MDSKKLGMKFLDYYGARGETHTVLWAFVCFFAIWAMLYFGEGTLNGWPILSAVAAMSAVILAAVLIVPLIAIQPLVLLSVFLEARWRIDHARPYVRPPPPPPPYAAPVPPPPKPPASRNPAEAG